MGIHKLFGIYRNSFLILAAAAFLACALILTGCGGEAGSGGSDGGAGNSANSSEFSIPRYSGEGAVSVNGGAPLFTDEEISKGEVSFESYGNKDSLGRCTAAFASLSRDTFPTGERQDISDIHPSGWPKNNKRGLMTRSHLIAYMLSGENANRKNLITGTEYFNSEVMLDYEIEVYDYIKKTGNHVLYRVTPIYSGKEPVARGVTMEALSVEDAGRGVSYNVFCFNVEPGYDVNYETGAVTPAEDAEKRTRSARAYVLNKGSRKFHFPTCSGVGDIYYKNKETVTMTRQKLIEQGYEPCGQCQP